MAAILFALASSICAQSVRITEKPEGLVHGVVYIPIQATEPVTRLALFVNGVKYTESPGRVMTAQLNAGYYIRRLRLQAVGYDAQGNVVAEDEATINDPRPPFRALLAAPAVLPPDGTVTLSANVAAPRDVSIAGVDFYIGEEKIGSAAVPPYTATFDIARFPGAVYARIVARTSDGQEANDVIFFGERARDQIDVTLQQIPVSVVEGRVPLRAEDVTLIDNGEPRKIESVVPADDQPLYLILLIDYSESMLEELPVVKSAAKQFAQKVLRPRDRIAVVGFNQRTFWLTPFTNDWNAAAQAVDRVTPVGETHLHDSVMEMLFELQKTPGRHALVVLTDGVDQGSAFRLEHLVHYARYAGVPIYPVVKNRLLGRLMRWGVGYLQARRLASIARDTGATYFIIQKESELPGVYARIASELRQQYQILFYSPPSGADQWHALRVESEAGQRLRAPLGYFP